MGRLIRVLEILKSSGKFCFGAGNPQVWVEVDWFMDDAPPSSKIESEQGAAEIEKFIRQKGYFDANKAYLVLHQARSFTIGYSAP